MQLCVEINYVVFGFRFMQLVLNLFYRRNYLKATNRKNAYKIVYGVVCLLFSCAMHSLQYQLYKHSKETLASVVFTASK